jgi:hypothetical protein
MFLFDRGAAPSCERLHADYSRSPTIRAGRGQIGHDSTDNEQDSANRASTGASIIGAVHQKSLLVTLLAGTFAARGIATTTPQGAPTCGSPEHRQFDFWLGEWDVYSGSQLAGTNSITSEHDGCVIAEHWVGTSGLTGSSLNVYDAATRRWHQTWVDSSGSLLLLNGRFADGAMRLASDAVSDAHDTDPGSDARRGTLDRITWTPNADGTLRQLWEQSTDGGRSWTIAFDGVYRRRAGSAAPSDDRNE